MPRGSPRSPRSQFFRACAVGGSAAMVVFTWLTLEGRANPFSSQVLANFYEVQARSLLHGHWDVPAGSLLFERFKIDGRYYTYFGPWPSLLRIPFVLFTDRLDARLSRVSMLAAFAVMLTYVSRLAWQTRCLVQGDSRLTRWTPVSAAGFVFVAGCGSSALFLGSWTAVYHEAILWGIAWAIASYSYLVSYLVAPSRRALVLAGVTATFAYLSRTSIGIGPLLSLGIVLICQCALRARHVLQRRRGAPESEPDARPEPAWLRWLGLRGDVVDRSARPIAIATALPILLGAYVNFSRFGTLFGLPPYERQDLLALRPHRLAALAASGGTLFGAEFAPTALLQYLRPDAISFDRLFPWVTFSSPPHVVGNAVFESIDFTASVAATSTLLVALSVLGAVAVLRAPRPAGEGATAAVLRVPLVTALAACVGALALAFLEQRYTGDFVPALVLASAAGLWWLHRTMHGRTRTARVCVATALVVVGAWSCWATGALALLYQRAYGPVVTAEARAGLIDFELAVHGALSGGEPSRVGRGSLSQRPANAAPGSLYVVGECAGLYWSNGREWHPVEQTPATGRFDLRVSFANGPAGSMEPLVAATDRRGSSILWVRHLGSHLVRLEYEWTGPPAFPATGAATPDVAVIGPAETEPIVIGDTAMSLTIRFDFEGYVGVRSGHEQLMSTFEPVAHSRAALGRQEISDRGSSRFTGTIHSFRAPTPVCDRLTNPEGP